ncbi:hypothetical protein Bbelb_013290 [Branchiostoma belcheri]|nr:hypothetical protein Bbelb_013290 [Branchiostoma belcheri]
MALQPNPVYQPEQISRGTLQAVSQGRKKRSSESSEDDAEELNEALMRTAITEQGRHPYRYGIASVNFKGDTRGTGNAALRKLLLGQLQGQTRVSILFVQECPWRDPVKQLQLSETFCYIGVTNEAGIIWNTELFELKRLDSYKLIGDKYPNLIQHRARVCISEMSIKHQPTELTASSDIAKEEAPNVSNFIAISWHGPHKCSEEKKQLIFLDLLAFLKTQTVTNDGQKAQALVIGGDFNLRLDKAWDNIDRYPGLAIPTSYGLETIDYFIFTSDLINILHAQHLSLGDDVGSVYTTLDRDRAKAEACKIPSDQIIDHRPVFAVLDLGRPNPFSSPSKIRINPVPSPSKITPNTISSPSKITHNPVSSPSRISPNPVSSPSRISPNPVSSPSRITHNPVSSPSRISPNPVSSPSRISPNPVSSPSRISPNPVSSPSRISPNPVSSPSRIRTRKTEERRIMDAPDCSTDGVQSSTRKEARQATNVTCGLSPTVTSAVVRRLIKEELILELQRRGIPPAEGTSNQDMIIQLRREIDGPGLVTTRRTYFFSVRFLGGYVCYVFSENVGKEWRRRTSLALAGLRKV